MGWKQHFWDYSCHWSISIITVLDTTVHLENNDNKTKRFHARLSLVTMLVYYYPSISSSRCFFLFPNLVHCSVTPGQCNRYPATWTGGTMTVTQFISVVPFIVLFNNQLVQLSAIQGKVQHSDSNLLKQLCCWGIVFSYLPGERVSLWKTETRVCFKYNLTNTHEGPSIFQPSNM